MTPTTPSPISHERAFHIALVLEMSELSDRNSPEDDPSAMVADSNEMAGCIERALERADLVLVPPAAPTTGSAPVAITKSKFAFTDGEIEACSTDPAILRALARVHEEIANDAETLDAEVRASYHITRASELKAKADIEERNMVDRGDYLAPLASPATSVLTYADRQTIERAVEAIDAYGNMQLGARIRALLAASMGGDKHE